MNFKQWVEQDDNLSHPDEQYEDAIAEAVYKLIAKSVSDFFSHRKQKKLSELLVANAGGNGYVRNFGSQAMPENGVEIKIPNNIKGVNLPQHFIAQGLKVRIKPVKGASGASMGSGVININIDPNILVTATEYKDQLVQSMLVRIQYQLHHEATHLSSGAIDGRNSTHSNNYLNGNEKSGSEKYNQGKIDYYTDAGELRAHAKQYAILYSRMYPNQPFDMNKMTALRPYSSKIDRYFIGLGEKSGQSKIWGMDTTQHSKQLADAQQKFMPLVKYFIDQKINKS
jgi:hypothetical protein